MKSMLLWEPTGDMTSSETFMLSFDLFGLVCVWYVWRQFLIKSDAPILLCYMMQCHSYSVVDDWSAFVSKWVSLFVVLTLSKATCDNKTLVRKPTHCEHSRPGNLRCGFAVTTNVLSSLMLNGCTGRLHLERFQSGMDFSRLFNVWKGN